MIRTLLYVLAASAVFIAVAPASTTIIQFDLDNVAEVTNPSVTFGGFFDYDTASNPHFDLTPNSPDFSITRYTSGLADFTLSPSNSEFFFNVSSDELVGIPNQTQSLDFQELVLTGGINVGLRFDGSVSKIPLLSGAPNGSFFVGLTTDPSGTPLALSGSLNEVPLPGALPLFACSLLVLCGLAATRKSRRMSETP